jgi:hypothetical protein
LKQFPEIKENWRKLTEASQRKRHKKRPRRADKEMNPVEIQLIERIAAAVENLTNAIVKLEARIDRLQNEPKQTPFATSKPRA